MTLPNALRFGAVIIAGFGVLTLLALVDALAMPIRLFLDLILWPPGNGASFAAPETRLLMALSGGFLCGWAVLIWALSGPLAALAPTEIRRAALASYGVWFVTDSTGSLLAGAPVNVLSNALFLALLTIPLLREPVIKASA